jgi:hypothetical protein
VKHLSTQTPPKRLLIRWKTLKGTAAIILFLILATLIEYAIVLYAINLGVKDTTQLQWNTQFPGTNWTLTITISPLFHLVPTAVIITLLFTWTYLTKRMATQPKEAWKTRTGPTTKRPKESRLKKIANKIKSGLLKVKAIRYLSQKLHFARTTAKGALALFLVFTTFILIFALLAYPKLIQQTISNAYKNDPSLLGFIKGSTEAFAPIGAVFSSLNNALLAASPGFRDIASGFGTIIKPLADLDNAGKYLFFQNAAAWISALIALFYEEYIRSTRRYRIARS